MSWQSAAFRKLNSASISCSLWLSKLINFSWTLNGSFGKCVLGFAVSNLINYMPRVCINPENQNIIKGYSVHVNNKCSASQILGKFPLRALGNGPRPYACKTFGLEVLFVLKSIWENFPTFCRNPWKGIKIYIYNSILFSFKGSFW